MKVFFLSTLVQCLLLMVQSSRLMEETMSIYRRVLADIKGRDDDFVTVADLKRLMELHDDDAYCGDWCQKYLSGMFSEIDSSANLQNGIPWPLFNEIADKIYGDLISDDPFEPQEIHLSLTGDATEMKVMWITMDALAEPFVEYKAVDDSTGEWLKAAALNYTYEVPQNWWPTFTGMIYSSTLKSLSPDAKYTYRVKGYDNSNQTERSSADFQFKAAPVNSPERTTKIAAVADQGTFMLLGFAVQKKLGELQDALGIDVATVVGDLSYAGLSSAMPHLNISKEDEFEHIWDLYGIQSQPVAATRPWMVTNGNHERFYDYAAFRNRYSMPAEKSGGSLSNFWYSYDYGNVHWVSISSEHDLEDGSVQKEWLRSNLAAAAAPERRAQFPWIVVALHKPLYCSADGWGTGYADLLENLLIEYNVDLTITGHMHIYERIHPTLQSAVSCYPQRKRSVVDGKVRYVDTYKSCGTGPVHVVQGNTGGIQLESFAQPAPVWSAVRFANGFITPNKTSEVTSLLGTLPEPLGREHWNYTNTFGFGVVTFVNSTHLQYNAVPITGEIGVDEFWITKQ